MLSLFYIKLDSIKLFVNALRKEGNCLKYKLKKFTLSDTKIMDRILIGTLISSLMNGKEFEVRMIVNE